MSEQNEPTGRHQLPDPLRVRRSPSGQEVAVLLPIPAHDPRFLYPDTDDTWVAVFLQSGSGLSVRMLEALEVDTWTELTP